MNTLMCTYSGINYILDHIGTWLTWQWMMLGFMNNQSLNSWLGFPRVWYYWHYFYLIYVGSWPEICSSCLWVGYWRYACHVYGSETKYMLVLISIAWPCWFLIMSFVQNRWWGLPIGRIRIWLTCCVHDDWLIHDKDTYHMISDMINHKIIHDKHNIKDTVT